MSQSHHETELQAQLAEVLFGIASSSEVTAAGGTAAQVSVITLEGNILNVQLHDAGISVISKDSHEKGAACKPMYDTVHSALINNSPAYMTKFNQQLAAQLQAAILERGEEY